MLVDIRQGAFGDRYRRNHVVKSYDLAQVFDSILILLKSIHKNLL